MRPAELIARTVDCPGCLASLRSVQGAAHLGPVKIYAQICLQAPAE